MSILAAASGGRRAQELGQIAHGQISQAAVVVAGHEAQEGQPAVGGRRQVGADCLQYLDAVGLQPVRQGIGIVSPQGQAGATPLAPRYGNPMPLGLRPVGRATVTEAAGQRPVDQNLNIGKGHGASGER